MSLGWFVYPAGVNELMYDYSPVGDNCMEDGGAIDPPTNGTLAGSILQQDVFVSFVNSLPSLGSNNIITSWDQYENSFFWWYFD